MYTRLRAGEQFNAREDSREHTILAYKYVKDSARKGESEIEDSVPRCLATLLMFCHAARVLFPDTVENAVLLRFAESVSVAQRVAICTFKLCKHRQLKILLCVFFYIRWLISALLPENSDQALYLRTIGKGKHLT